MATPKDPVITVEVKRKRQPFTMVQNAIIRNDKLSLKAVGIMAFLLSLHPDVSARVSLSYIISKRNHDHRHSIRMALRELESAGYLQVTYIRDKGRFTGTKWIVTDEPLLPRSSNPACEPTEKPS